MDDLPIKHKSEGVQHCSYRTCNSDTKYRHREDMKGVHKQVKQSPPKRKAPAKTKKDETKSAKSRTKFSTSNTPNASSTVVQKVKHSPPKRKASVTKDPPRKKAKEDETKSAKSRTKLSTSNTPNASSTVVQKHSPLKRKASASKDPPEQKAKKDEAKSAKSRTKLSSSNTPKATSTVAPKNSPLKRKAPPTKDPPEKKAKKDETKSAKSRTKLSSSNIPKASSTVVPKITLYRLLRPDEDPAIGLSAKNPNSDLSVEEHVENGSYGPGSRYISCCKSMKGLHKFSTKSKTNPKRVVEINISMDAIIDLTDPGTLFTYISPLNEKAGNYVNKFKEVLVEGFIPPNCITRSFYL